MKKIPLTQGYFALVDDEDYERVSKIKWHVHMNGNSTPYARASPKEKRIGGGKRITIKSGILMHRFILNLGDSKQRADHVNGDGLDNRKENLRLATHSENCKNRKPRGSSKYLGVHFDDSRGRNHWRFEICIQRANKKKGIKRKRISGRVATEEEAARRYDELAKKYHKEFANLNFKD